MPSLAENLAHIREQIAAAALASGRQPADVRLIAVTKYVEPAAARLLARAGASDLGESRPQELWRKAAELADEPGIRWHFIGPLQRNKVRRTLPLIGLLHSGESLRLLQTLHDEAAQLPAVKRPVPVLLEVNISGDPAKHGFAPAELAPVLPQLAKLSHLKIQGLMGMASLEGDAHCARQQFAALRELRDRLRNVAPPEIVLRELSMGMSGDFQEAILEGATLVRIGSALWEGVFLGSKGSE